MKINPRSSSRNIYLLPSSSSRAGQARGLHLRRRRVCDCPARAPAPASVTHGRQPTADAACRWCAHRHGRRPTAGVRYALTLPAGSWDQQSRPISQRGVFGRCRSRPTPDPIFQLQCVKARCGTSLHNQVVSILPAGHWQVPRS
ncbi:unnamed protein product [Urochloa humidicola]